MSAFCLECGAYGSRLNSDGEMRCYECLKKEGQSPADEFLADMEKSFNQPTTGED